MPPVLMYPRIYRPPVEAPTGTSTLRAGEGAPATDAGESGDLYLDASTGTLYRKESA